MKNHKNSTKSEIMAKIQSQGDAKIAIEKGAVTVNDYNDPAQKVTVNIIDSKTTYIPLEDMYSDNHSKYVGYLCCTEFSFELEGKRYTISYQDNSFITDKGELVCQTDGPSVTNPDDCETATHKRIEDVAYAIVAHFVEVKLKEWQECRAKNRSQCILGSNEDV